MSTYKSQGTVSCCVGSADAQINFVPHGNYTVNHEGKSYAVFLADDGSCNDGIRCISRLCKNKEEKPIGVLIKISVDRLSIFVRAQSAIMTHSKVEVEVETAESDESGGLTLTNIVPVK